MSSLKRVFAEEDDDGPPVVAPVPAVVAVQPVAPVEGPRVKKTRFADASTVNPGAPPPHLDPGSKRTELPPPLRVDHLGRELDAFGAPIIPPVLPPPALRRPGPPTFSAPQHHQQYQQQQQPSLAAPGGGDSVFGSIVAPTKSAPPVARFNPYLDAPSGGGELAPSRKGAFRDFRFFEPGVISARAEEERAREARKRPVGGFRRPVRIAEPVVAVVVAPTQKAAASEAVVEGGGKEGGATNTTAASTGGPVPAAPATAVVSLAVAPPLPPVSVTPFVSSAPASAPTTSSGGGSSGASGAPAYACAPVPQIEWWDAPFLPPARAKAFSLAFPPAGKMRAAAAAAAAAAATVGAASSASGTTTTTTTTTTAPGPTGSASAAPSGGALPPTHFSYSECTLAHCKTLGLVAHPVPLSASGEALATLEPPPPPPMPLILTAKERAKLRRRTREERHKAVADQVRMGLLPPPPPKVRLSNLMRVLKDTAVADPTVMEAKIKADTAARVAAHDARNAASKKTPGERAAKWKAKVSALGPGGGVSAALFCVDDLEGGRARYKLDVNAKQLFLTGLVVGVKEGVEVVVEGEGEGEGEMGGSSSGGAEKLASSVLVPTNLVYVEGGVLGVKKYTKLLLSRINWREKKSRRGGGKGGEGEEGGGGEGGAMEHDDEEEDDEDEEEEEEEEEEDGEGGGEKGGASWDRSGLGPNGKRMSDKSGKCRLVWTGTVQATHCQDFHFEECTTGMGARRTMETRGLAHHWDACVNSAKEAFLAKERQF